MGTDEKWQNRKQGFMFLPVMQATSPADMDFSGSGLHQLKGSLKDYWAVKVSGNWRMTFRFEAGHAYVVDYQDYH